MRTLRISAIVVLAMAAVACGDNDGVETGSSEEFCTDWDRADEVLGDLEPESADDFRRIRDAMEEMVYPEQLADEAVSVLVGLDELIEIIEENDGNLTNLTPKEQEALSEEFTDFADASTAVGEYAGDNCEGNSDSEFDYICAEIDMEGPCGPDGQPLDE